MPLYRIAQELERTGVKIPVPTLGNWVIRCSERYLKVFLDDGSVPIDNSACERAIRPFCVGRSNWHICDSIHGAKASAVVYSLVETAKANRLKPYEYLKHLLTEIPKHMDDSDTAFLEDLLPWSDTIPDICKKPEP